MALLTAEARRPAPIDVDASRRQTAGQVLSTRFRLWNGLQYGLPNSSSWWERYRQRDIRSHHWDYVPDGESDISGYMIRTWLGRTASNETLIQDRVRLMTQPIERGAVGSKGLLWRPLGKAAVRAETRESEVFIHVPGYGLVSPDLFQRLFPLPSDQLEIVNSHVETVENLAKEANLPRPDEVKGSS